jgi:hypothetical protein
MDYSSLPRYPAHDEVDSSQADRLREGSAGPNLSQWLMLTMLAVALYAAGVLVCLRVIGQAVAGLAA